MKKAECSMRKAKWKMERRRKLVNINQLRVTIPGSFCLGGGAWCVWGKSQQDNRLRQNVQKCCYGVGRVWIRCGSLGTRSGSMHRGIIKPNRFVFGRFGMVAGSDLLLAPRGHTVRIWRVSAALESAKAGTDPTDSSWF